MSTRSHFEHFPKAEKWACKAPHFHWGICNKWISGFYRASSRSRKQDENELNSTAQLSKPLLSMHAWTDGKSIHHLFIKFIDIFFCKLLTLLQLMAGHLRLFFSLPLKMFILQHPPVQPWFLFSSWKHWTLLYLSNCDFEWHDIVDA